MSSISVIIPAFNNTKWLPLTLNSCLAQKDHLKEIIVVDDYSTDDTWGVLHEYQAKYPQTIKIFKNRSKGGNNARNYGFSLSTGEFIQWLDADDQITEGKFAAQLKLFEFDDSVDIVYSDWKLVTYNTSGNVIREEIKKKSSIRTI